MGTSLGCLIHRKRIACAAEITQRTGPLRCIRRGIGTLCTAAAACCLPMEVARNVRGQAHQLGGCLHASVLLCAAAAAAAPTEAVRDPLRGEHVHAARQPACSSFRAAHHAPAMCTQQCAAGVRQQCAEPCTNASHFCTSPSGASQGIMSCFQCDRQFVKVRIRSWVSRACTNPEKESLEAQKGEGISKGSKHSPPCPHVHLGSDRWLPGWIPDPAARSKCCT